MTDAVDLRRGWCPGALTPMETGDGWLVRVKPRAGSYRLAQVKAVAEVANEAGNGQIDLTSRASLQIRGLSPATIPRAQSVVSAAGLIDADAAIEAVRNVIVAPLAGVDPGTVDVRPLARALEAVLKADHRLHALPGKFGFAVDGGGRFPLPEGLADITLRAGPDGIAVEIAGGISAPLASDERALAAAVALAAGFVEAARNAPAIRRLRDVVRVAGAGAIFAGAGLEVRAVSPAPDAAGQDRPVGQLGDPGRPCAIGIGLPYGRITGSALLQLAEAAEGCGASDVRPCPGRILILPLEAGRMEPVARIAAALGLITAPGDSRLQMDVCPGAPDCGRGTTSTRDDADAIARLHPPVMGGLHISGCPKGCARRGPAGLTLLARGGRYDIIREGDVSAAAIRTGVASGELPGLLATLGLGAGHG